LSEGGSFSASASGLTSTAMSSSLLSQSKCTRCWNSYLAQCKYSGHKLSRDHWTEWIKCVKYVCYDCPLVSSPKLLQGFKWKMVWLLLHEFQLCCMFSSG
jgi:hypothetical protein